MGFLPTLKTVRSWGPGDDRWFKPISPPTIAGVSVDEDRAMTYLTVAACVTLIAGDVAKLPLMLFKRKNNGDRERAMAHPLYDILHSSPNRETTSFLWREACQSHLLLWGNSYNVKEFDQRGRLIGLYPLDPSSVKVERKKGQIVYTWHDSAQNREITRTRDDVFHIPGFGYNGIVGKSPITMAREAIGLGMSQEEYQARFVGSGTHPAGVLMMEGYLGEKGAKNFKKSFAEQYQGLGRSHSVMVLEGGLKYEPISMSMDDAQFLESRTFQKLEICGFFHAPPHKIAIHGSNSNYNNLEQENQNYVDTCLSHWVTRWESSLTSQLLSAEDRKKGYYIKFVLNALLRGDQKTRGEFYHKLWQMGYPLNRILEKEDENRVEGGDVGLVPMNTMPAKFVEDMTKVQIDQAKNPPAPVPVNPDDPDEEDRHLIELYKSGGGLAQIRWEGFREKRGIMVRDRISRQYKILFNQAAQTIVNREAKTIKNKLNKRSDLEKFIKYFYREVMPKYILEKMGPVIMSYASAIHDASIDEIGVDQGVDNQFVSSYMDKYVTRHISRSEGQLMALVGDDEDEKIEIRVDEWSETRAEKIATEETVKLSNAVFQVVAWGAGLSTVWRIRGAETCPYCREFDGRRVARGESFIGAGDKVAPKGLSPMKVRGMKAHPPLHAGCDCYLGV